MSNLNTSHHQLSLRSQQCLRKCPHVRQANMCLPMNSQCTIITGNIPTRRPHNRAKYRIALRYLAKFTRHRPMGLHLHTQQQHISSRFTMATYNTHHINIMESYSSQSETTSTILHHYHMSTILEFHNTLQAHHGNTPTKRLYRHLNHQTFIQSRHKHTIHPLEIQLFDLNTHSLLFQITVAVRP